MKRRLAKGLHNFALSLLSKTSAGRRFLFSRFALFNRWGSPESRSGPGSTYAETEVIRRELPRLFEAEDIRTLLDIPCGDGHWIRSVNGALDTYYGADIVSALIDELALTATANEEFLSLDLVSDSLPKADAVLCRDALVHLSFEQALLSISNIRRSGARLLIATTFPGRTNQDIPTGSWRPLDLSQSPFDLGRPTTLINEQCSEGDGQFADKSLGVWRLQ